MSDVFIDDFYTPADGDDWLPAFERVQRVLGTAGLGTGRSSAPPKYDFRGFTLRFAAREYYFSAALQIICPLALVGSGGHASYAGTILMFPKGSKGLVFHGVNTIRFAKFGDVARPAETSFANGAVLEKITVMAVDPVTRGEGQLHALTDLRQSGYRPNPGAHGVTAYTQITLRDVRIANFGGHGVYIYGNGGGTDLTTPDVSCIAAMTQLDNVYVVNSGGDGLHIFGHDGNVCLVQSCQFVHNAGWGIRDLSALGQTTVLGGQVSYNILGGVCRPHALYNTDCGGLAEIYAAELRAAQDAPQAQAAAAAVSLFDCLSRALPEALAAGKAAMDGAFAADPNTPKLARRFPDVANYPLLQQSIQDNLVDHFAAEVFYQCVMDYHQAHEDLAGHVGDALQRALIDEGQSAPPTITHLIYLNPFATGGDIFINVYGESNGPGEGLRNILSVHNLCIGSEVVSNGTEARCLSGTADKILLDGGDGADVVATHRLLAGGAVEAPSVRLGAILEPVALDTRDGRTLSNSATPPTAAGQVGDIVFNTDPAPGGFVGWVATAAGWKTFGPISV